MATGINPLVSVKNTGQIQRERDELSKIANPPNEQLLSAIASRIRDRFEQAKEAKRPIEARLIACKLAVRSQYPPEKIASIKEIYGANFDPPYAPVTATKCSDLVSWMKDRLLMQNKDLFALSPTPIPELPQEVSAQIEASVAKEYMQMATQLMTETMQSVDMQTLAQQIKVLQPEIKEKILQEEIEASKEAAEKATLKINDQFAEGGFNKALSELIHDIAVYPNVFMQTSLSKIKTRKRIQNIQTGKFTTHIVEEIIPTYKNISPFDVYPVNNAPNLNDTDVIILKTLTPNDIFNLIGVEGYDEKAVTEVLAEYRAGGLREWLNVSSSKDQLEDKNPSGHYDFIDCIEYQGYASGEMLKEWAGHEDKAKKIFGEDLEDVKEYSIIAWLIGDKVIKAILNPDVLGDKNIVTTSLYPDPHNLWSPSSLPERIAVTQNLINSVTRALLVNVSIASAPMIEWNSEKFPTGTLPIIRPLMAFVTTNNQMGDKAVNFYQPPLIAKALAEIRSIAEVWVDGESGVPKYLQGSNSGLVATSSGMSMQMDNQTRNLNSMAMNIYSDIIHEIAKRQYHFNLEYLEDMGMVGDCNVKPTGLMEIMQESQTQRNRMEYLNGVAQNQVRTQIVGMKGLRYLEEKVAEGLGLEVDEIWDSNANMQEELLEAMGGGMPMQPNMGTPENPVAVDAAGNPQGGAAMNNQLESKVQGTGMIG